MDEYKKPRKKRAHAEYRKLWHNDYLSGRISLETKMIQWTHFMMENWMFELQKQQYFLDYELACKKFKREYVNCLINKNYFYMKQKERQHEDEEKVLYIFSKNIDENIEKCDEISAIATARVNKRYEDGY
jgi:hypothetical protein